jgi:SAM-dependent methyltransferase
LVRREYLLSNGAAEAQKRLEALSSLFDPGTFRCFDAVGVAPGWRCWEVGAGGPSVVKWLAERVGPTGRVLATDIDISRVSGAAGGAVEVRVHDVGRDEPPLEEFELVHARLVLVHVAGREAALGAMTRALAPGGFLVIEDADPALLSDACIETAFAEQELANTLRRGFRSLMAGRGVDLAYGRKLPRLLRDLGLTGVTAGAFFPIGHDACRILEDATVRQLADELVAAELATREQIQQHLANVAAGNLDLVTAPMISAWGKKPGRPLSDS